MNRAKANVPGPLVIVERQESEGVVKSARRVLEILEFFDDVQRPATVMEVSGALDYPQSSTSALLRSLARLGYLDHDPFSRTYVSSIRTALLGNWVNAEFVRVGPVIEMMQELNRLTGDNVILAARNGLQCQYVHVLQALNPARAHLTLGTVRGLATSGAGRALMSVMPDRDIQRLVLRINAEAKPGAPVVSSADLMASIREIRATGYSFTTDTVTAGGGILAATLPIRVGGQIMVVGIGGCSSAMRDRKAQLVEILFGAIARHFGGLDERPTAVRDTAPPASANQA